MALVLFKVFMLYYIVINIISFSVMGIDKKRAENGKWRIKEKTLFLTAIIGGSMGSVLGMQFFRHKTKHLSFLVGMPIILIIHLVIIIQVVIL